MVEIERPADHLMVNRTQLARQARWRRQMLAADRLLAAGRLEEAAAAAEQADDIHGFVEDRRDYLWLLEQIRRRQRADCRLTDGRLYRTVDTQLLRYGPRRAWSALTAIRYAVVSVREYQRYEQVLQGMMTRRQHDLIDREERTKLS